MSDSITNETAAAQKPNLNISDILNVLQLIKTCSVRGAFQAEELSSVGSLYDRLQAFCVATGAIKPAEPKTETTEQQ